MDPLKYFPFEITERVLQHMSCQQLLKASLVSSFWDEVIGDSSVAMRKIKIKIAWQSDESFFGEASDLMAQSPRKYQHLEFLHQSSCKNSIKRVCDILAVTGRQWKSVKLKRISFQNIGEVNQLFGVIAETVESLDIHEIYIYNRRGKTFEGLQFPKLTTLRAKHMDLSFIEAFANCRKLKDLSITSGDPLPPAVEAFKLVLENNNLKSLEISSNLFKEVFGDNDISLKINFKLKSFVASELFKIKKNTDTIFMNFHNFLQSQMNDLETLSVDEWMGVNVLKLMFHLPQLKSLSMNGLNNVELTHKWLSLRVNRSITKLSFHDMDPMYQIFKELINATPNLEELEMHSMAQSTMQYLSTNAIHLKILKLRTIDATDLSNIDLFPKLEEFSIDIIQSDLEDEITNIPLSQQNRLVKLMLQSTYTILH